MTPESIVSVFTSLLEQFRGAGFYMPRTREQLRLRFVGAPVVRECIIDQLIQHGVIEEDEGRVLKVVRKNSASVTALLDNGTLNGAVHAAVNEVVKRFRPGLATVG